MNPTARRALLMLHLVVLVFLLRASLVHLGQSYLLLDVGLTATPTDRRENTAQWIVVINHHQLLGVGSSNYNHHHYHHAYIIIYITSI